MAAWDYNMPNYPFHRRVCRFMYLSVHWYLLTWSFKEDISVSFFLIPPCLRRAGPPLSFKLPSLLIYKCSWYRFFLLFPLNFLVLISVFYDFDCVIRNWLLRLPVSPCQPWSQPLCARAGREGGRDSCARLVLTWRCTIAEGREVGGSWWAADELPVVSVWWQGGEGWAGKRTKSWPPT